MTIGQRVARKAGHPAGQDSPAGLAFYFQASVRDKGWGSSGVNVKALMAHFAIWKRDGLEAAQIREMIDLFFREYQPAKTKTAPWRVLIDRKVHLQEAAKNDEVAFGKRIEAIRYDREAWGWGQPMPVKEHDPSDWDYRV